MEFNNHFKEKGTCEGCKIETEVLVVPELPDKRFINLCEACYLKPWRNQT